MPHRTDATIKVLGGRNLPPYWERFDRLQQTAHRLAGGVASPRGVFRFATHADLEAWKMTQILDRPDRPPAPTS